MGLSGDSNFLPSRGVQQKNTTQGRRAPEASGWLLHQDRGWCATCPLPHLPDAARDLSIWCFRPHSGQGRYMAQSGALARTYSDDYNDEATASRILGGSCDNSPEYLPTLCHKPTETMPLQDSLHFLLLQPSAAAIARSLVHLAHDWLAPDVATVRQVVQISKFPIQN